MQAAMRLGFIALLGLAFGCSAEAPSADEGVSGGGPQPSGGTAGVTNVAGAGGAAGGGGMAGAAAGGAGAGGGAAAAFPSPEWPSGSPEAHGLDPAAIDLAMSAAEQHGSYCLLVIRHGVLVAERYWQGHDASTPQRSWSIAKSYSSALVGIAIARGDISSLDASVADYLPEWKGTDREAVTFRHILSMTTGLEWSAFDDYFVLATLAQDHTKHALGRKLAKAPGSEWVYNNAAIQLLEPVFRNATGKSIEQYAEAHLWSKLQMKASWARDPTDHPTAYASVLASCRDHARLGYLYLHGGRWGAEQIVPQDFVELSLSPSQPQNRAYGLLWWLNAETPAMDAMKGPWPGRMVPFAPADHFAARGFGNQFIDVFPSRDLLVVRFGPDPLGSFDLAALTSDQHFAKHDQILAPVLGAIVD